MQELDIPSVKILNYEKTDNPKVLKYTYFDTQTGLKDYFYSHQRVRHILNLPGTLFLTIDDNQQKKFFFDFSHRLHEFYLKEPIKFEKSIEEEIKEIKKKKIITKLAPWQIRKLREKDFSWQEIREFCGVSEWTIRRWRKEEVSKEKQKPGRKPKINGNDLVLLESCVDDAFKERTQQWMAEHFSRKIGQKISQPTVCRLYKKYGITSKTPIYNYSEQKVFLEDIKPFTEMVKSLPQHLIIATDECAFYLNEAPRRAYGWKGERVISWKPGKFTTRYTLMLCIRNVEKQAVVSYKLIEHDNKKKEKKKDKKKINKGTGSVEFHDFIIDVKSKLPTNEKYRLLLDNAKIHKAIEVLKKANRLPIRELFTQINIEPLYLVPYTPQLNPVELIFNILRKYAEEKQPRDFERLKLVIEEKIAELQKEDMRKWFRHCMDYGFKTSK